MADGPEGGQYESLRSIRQEILTEFAENAGDEALWQAAYDCVRMDGDMVAGTDESGLMVDAIPGEDLISFAEQIRRTEPGARYDLMVTAAPNGQKWFDVLGTFSSPQIERAKAVVLDQVFHYGHDRTVPVLDVGTGTGKSLTTLEAFSDNVIGVDRSGTLLHEALVTKAETTRLVQAEVTAMPFADGSFDIIGSSGLSVALDRNTSVQFYTEVARLLKNGGVYIDGSYHTNEWGYPGREMADLTVSSKAMLADMMVDTVSGKLQLMDNIEADEYAELIGELGLDENYYLVEDMEYGDGSVSAVRVLTKG